jgi:hypothetical protein
MKKPTGDDRSFECGGLQDATGSIFSDLMGLITRLQTSIAFSERAMATIGLDDGEAAGTVFVLDDVTPRYTMTHVALSACHAALGEALCHLLEAKLSGVSPRPARAARVYQCGI